MTTPSTRNEQITPVPAAFIALMQRLSKPTITGSENPQTNGKEQHLPGGAGAPQGALNGSDTIQTRPEAPQGRLEAACPSAEAVQQQFLAFMAAGCPKGLHFHVTLKTGPKFQTWTWDGKPLTPQGAWYFSTGGSNHKRLRQEANQKAFRAIVLDDVWSKVDPAKIKLEPTFKLITSADNEQWGYVIEWTDDIEGGDALMQALADAGLQDKAVNTCCRLFRLPGSINDKPDRDNFVSTLTELHTERIFTIESIAAGLGLTITREPPEPERNSTKVAPTTDRLFNWLNDNGHIKRTSDGIHHIIECPWPKEHEGDPRTEAWVCPATVSKTGVFAAGCWHGHGQGDNASIYRRRVMDWVREQGGPRENDTSDFRALLIEHREYAKANGIPCEPWFTSARTESAKATAAPQAVLIMGYRDFITLYAKAPDWLMAGLLQRSYLYAMTGKWGHGKTAIALTQALHIATGKTFMGRPVARTKVLYWAGENPGDVALRIPATCKALGIDEALLDGWLDFVPFAFTVGAVDGDSLSPTAAAVAAQAKTTGSGLIFVDTGVAYAGLQEENDNAEMHHFAKMLRRVMQESGGAAVVALMHPPKDCTRDTITVRGGGAFLGEIDGEMLVWQEPKTRQAELFHMQKWRGPGFDPVMFKLEKLNLPLLDNFGKNAITVAAVPTDEERIQMPKPNAKGQWALLRALADLGLTGLSKPLPWPLVEAAWGKRMDLSSVGSHQRRNLKTAIEALVAMRLLRCIDAGLPTGTVAAGTNWGRAREAGKL